MAHGTPSTGDATVIKDEDGELGVGIRDSARTGISGESLFQAAFLEVLGMIWACPFVHGTPGPSKKHLWSNRG